jgi:hypothetical protein
MLPRVMLPRLMPPRVMLPRLMLPRLMLPRLMLPRLMLPRLMLPRLMLPRLPCCAVTEYIDAIHKLLRPGGFWINLGPLLYHWANRDEDEEEDERFSRAMEFPFEGVRSLIEGSGFSLKQEQWKKCMYTENSSSMMRTQYECAFFTAVKSA